MTVIFSFSFFFFFKGILGLFLKRAGFLRHAVDLFDLVLTVVVFYVVGFVVGPFLQELVDGGIVLDENSFAVLRQHHELCLALNVVSLVSPFVRRWSSGERQASASKKSN